VTVLERDTHPAEGRPDPRAVRRRVPGPLVVLVLVVVVEALTWITVMPPFQGPDEANHFAYTQKIAEAHTIPWQSVGGAPPDGTPQFSTEMIGALSTAGILSSWGNPDGRPAGTRVDERMWDRLERGYDHADRADGGFTSTMAYPPAYYLYETIPYLATRSASLFDRAFAMRLANVPLLIVVLVFCWLIAGELLGHRRWLQVLATAAVAVQPQLIHMTATINPDVALAAIWCPALWLMIRILRAGPNRARAVWLVVLVALSSLTQPRGLALLLPAATTLAIAWRRRHPSASGRAWWAVRGGVAALFMATLVALADYAVAGDPSLQRMRQFVSYGWQFYLPRLGFMTPVEPRWGIRQALIDRLFGGYAQLEVSPPSWVLTVITVAAVAIAASALFAVVRRFRREAPPADVAAVLAVAVIGYLLLLHAAAFRSLLQGPDPVITGRYLLPLMPLYGAGIALAVSWLPRRAAVSAAVVTLAGLTVLQVGALALVFTRFYA
jgi:4-amino-4-deoxy-L-arabinose transferase-like glycosyltransferase